jgi:2'-5' RNA ligase
VRLFFALTPDAVAANRLRAVAVGLDRVASLQSVPPENYHITLAFLGEVASDALPSICQIGVAQQVSRAAISLDACEYWSQSGVVVATATAIAPSIADLAARLQSDIAVYHTGTRAEPPWRPHVTLARKVLQPPVLPAMSAITWTASSFALMSSQRRDGRSVYTVVDTWSLLDSEPKL